MRTSKRSLRSGMCLASFPALFELGLMITSRDGFKVSAGIDWEKAVAKN